MNEKANKSKRIYFIREILLSALVLAFWIGVWALVAAIVKSELLFPSPIRVFSRLIELAATKDFYLTLLFSLLRVVSGIVLSVVLGILLALLTEYVGFFRRLIQPIMTLIKSTPVASFILLALVWIKRSIIPVFIVVLIALPIVWANVSEGIRRMDKDIMQMLRLYRVPFLKRFWKFYVPSVAPYFRSALLSATGLSWKSGIAAEVLTVPLYAIGTMLFTSKQYLETVDLFAWTFCVIILSYLIEKLISFITKKVLFKADEEPKKANGGESVAKN